MSSRRRHGRGGLGLLLLAGQISQIGVDRIPPVTLGIVAVNALIYLRLIPNLPKVHGACTSYSKVIKDRQYGRIIASSFYHLDDMHLYFNMVSFIWKGVKLENKLKSRRFFILIAIFSILTQVVMLLLNYMLYEAFNNSQYLHTCAAGFSAVIFGLKVLTTSHSNNSVRVMGMPLPVPARYACWVELILIQILVPQASFTGHLSGILVGLIYVYGPLKKIIKLLDKLASGRWLFAPRNTYDARQAGNHYSNASPRQQQQSRSRCIDDEDEQLQEAIRASLNETSFNQSNQQRSPTYGWNIPEKNDRTDFTRVYEKRKSNPSAPPLNESVDSSISSFTERPPPYPTNDPPYPTNHTPLYPRLDNLYAEGTSSRTSDAYMEDHEDRDMEYMRNARLRKFDKR